MEHNTWKTPVSLAAVAFLALTACAENEDPDASGEAAEPDVTETVTEEPDDSEPGDADTDDADTVGTESEEPAQEETTEPAEALPPGGADRIADEDIDSETQGEPTETNFSAEGEEIGFNEMAEDRESIEVWAQPSVPGDEGETGAVAELEADDVVRLAGREILAAQANGIWVEVELADGYGWVEAAVLEGYEGPNGTDAP